MKLTLILSTLLFSLSSFADVRPGGVIKQSIDSHNSAELAGDLGALNINVDANTILNAVKANIITADSLSKLLSTNDSNKQALVKSYVEGQLVAVETLGSRNAFNTSNGDALNNRKLEAKKTAEILISSINGGDINVDNMPRIIEILTKVAKGEMSDVEANLALKSENLVKVNEDQNPIEEYRKCNS